MRFQNYTNNTINVGANLITQKGGKFPVIETLHNESLISGHLLCQSVYVFSLYCSARQSNTWQPLTEMTTTGELQPGWPIGGGPGRLMEVAAWFNLQLHDTIVLLGVLLTFNFI